MLSSQNAIVNSQRYVSLQYNGSLRYQREKQLGIYLQCGVMKFLLISSFNLKTNFTVL